MDNRGTVTMSRKELNRLQILNRALERRLTQAKAAEQLGLSLRQVERLCRRLRDEGPDGLVSKRRDRPSNRKLPDTQREHALSPRAGGLRRLWAALGGASWSREPYLDYLTRPIARAWLDHYVDAEHHADPFASPIHGDLRGLPPILMYAGTVEGLFDEIECLADKLRQADISLTYRVIPEMPHVWHLFAPMLPQADEALREIADFVAETTRDEGGGGGGKPTGAVA